MSEKINNPHDQFFRAAFSRPDVAQSFLTNYLPPEVAEKLDAASFAATQESFVDADLQPHHTDLLFRGKLKTGASATVFVLLEHKSVPDAAVAFQLLRYIVRIWEKASQEKAQKLPLIFPVVLYHGRARWKISRQFADLITNSNTFAEFVPHFKYELCDLSEFDEEELKGTAFLQAAMFALKNVFDKSLTEKISDLWQLFKFKQEAETIEYISIIVRYILTANQSITADAVRKSLTTTFLGRESEVMTTAMKEFINEGIQQGIQQGEQRGLAKQTLRLLNRKLGRLSAESEQRVNNLSIEQIELLGDALLDFESSADLAAWLEEHSN